MITTINEFKNINENLESNKIFTPNQNIVGIDSEKILAELNIAYYDYTDSELTEEEINSLILPLLTDEVYQNYVDKYYSMLISYDGDDKDQEQFDICIEILKSLNLLTGDYDED